MRFFFILLLLSATIPAMCTKKDPTDRSVFAMGAMFGEKLFVLHADYGFSINNNLYKIGYSGRGRLLPSNTDDQNNTNDFLQAASLSIGERFRSDDFEAYVFAGPALVWGHKGSTSDHESAITTVGLETKVLLMFRAADYADIGVGCFSVLNTAKSFYGITFSIALTNGN